MVLTVDDLQKITLLINTGLGNLKDHVDEKFSEAFRLLPTKEEFFSRMDELMHEVKAMREEQTMHQGQHDRLDGRVARVEKKLNLPQFVD